MSKAATAIKPHHFVDILTSFGDGKRSFHSHPYGHAVHTISEQVLADRDFVLKIELGADDICGPCVHNDGGSCVDTIDTSYRPAAPSSKREWNLLIDERWCERIGAQQGDRFIARDLAKRIQDYMGDIADIYREIPVEMTKERAQKLIKGLQFYCGSRVG
jgi:hypothetical protein